MSARRRQRKKARRVRWQMKEQQAGISVQWEEATSRMRSAVRAEARWRSLSETCVSAQVGRVQARVCRFVTKAAVLRQLTRVFSRERAMRQREKATQVEISHTAVGMQTRAAKANQRCKAVQCEAETATVVTQTEGNDGERARVVTAATQTKRPKTKTQNQQTEACLETKGSRETNPSVKAVTAKAAKEKRELQIEVMGRVGSKAETTENEKMKQAIMIERIRRALECKEPDKTTLVLLSEIKKALMIRSREPKIPW